MGHTRCNTLYSVEMEDQSHVYEKVTPLQHPTSTLANTYLEEPHIHVKDRPTHTRRKGTADQKKKRHMLPPITPAPPNSTHSDDVYMCLKGKQPRQEEDQSQYMSLCAATRKTHSSAGATAAWRRAQGSCQEAQQESPEEPLYVNQIFK